MSSSVTLFSNTLKIGDQSMCILISREQCQTYHITPKYAQIHLKDNNTCNIKTNIFRNTPIQKAIKPINTISHLTRGQYYTNNESEKSGIYIMGLKTYATNFSGYSPLPIKQKSSYQHGSKSEQVLRYRLLCRNPRNVVINKKHATMINA